ncbi:hypothetical protein [uncultured Olegusella sp.]|uniref:hypothetical protein n=1 Tax=uncultured Olegusella sp. TaxID=1979846 RepID=UPI0026102C3A|nr:hypothetical protein [uncultured Olegusella sp.]
MTPKITPEQLRRCANMYDNEPTYSLISIMEDIGAEVRLDSGYDRLTSAILEVIADSIDEHYVDKHETLGGRYAELPTSKDGEQIHIGNTVYDKEGTIYYVQGISTGKLNLFLSKFGKGKDCAKPYRSQDFTKIKPDSWERIIQDAFMTGMDFIAEDGEELMLKHGCSKDELIARCRKLAGESK